MVLDIVSIVFDDVGLVLQYYEVFGEYSLDLLHLFDHQALQTFLVHVQFGFEEVGQFGGYLTSIDVQCSLGDVFDARFDISVPVVELRNLLFDFFERNVILLPVGWNEVVHELDNFTDLLVVLFNVSSGNGEVHLHLLLHFVLDSDVLD